MTLEYFLVNKYSFAQYWSVFKLLVKPVIVNNLCDIKKIVRLKCLNGFHKLDLFKFLFWCTMLPGLPNIHLSAGEAGGFFSTIPVEQPLTIPAVNVVLSEQGLDRRKQSRLMISRLSRCPFWNCPDRESRLRQQY